MLPRTYFQEDPMHLELMAVIVPMAVVAIEPNFIVAMSVMRAIELEGLVEA